MAPSTSARYFEVATDASVARAVRGASRDSRRAGAVVLVTRGPQDYVARYGEPDKAASGLEELDAWPLPYWHTDAAMATMALLLLLEESGVAGHDLGKLPPRPSGAGVGGHRGDEELFASVLIGRGRRGRRCSLELAGTRR